MELYRPLIVLTYEPYNEKHSMARQAKTSSDDTVAILKGSVTYNKDLEILQQAFLR